MGAGFYSAIVAILKEHGCTFKRQAKGDHDMWYSPFSGRHFPVDRGCQSRHTANAIMKQAGIDHKF
jgi:hypothetical protein